MNSYKYHFEIDISLKYKKYKNKKNSILIIY